MLAVQGAGAGSSAQLQVLCFIWAKTAVAQVQLFTVKLRSHGMSIWFLLNILYLLV